MFDIAFFLRIRHNEEKHTHCSTFINFSSIDFIFIIVKSTWLSSLVPPSKFYRGFLDNFRSHLFLRQRNAKNSWTGQIQGGRLNLTSTVSHKTTKADLQAQSFKEGFTVSTLILIIILHDRPCHISLFWIQIMLHSVQKFLTIVNCQNWAENIWCIQL